MRRLLTLLLGDWRSDDVVVECRRCGATLPGDADDCPECSAESTVTYEIG